MTEEYTIALKVGAAESEEVSSEATGGDALLVQLAKQDSRHFKALYEKYFKCIYGFVFHRIRDKDEALDITSQVFLKGLLKIDTYRYMKLPFSAWLYKIAFNEINQFYRKASRAKTVILEDHAVKQISEEIEDENLEWRKEKLARVLQWFKPKEMELIELRFQLGMSYKEIAGIIGGSEINARVRLHRLISKIKDMWEES